MLIVSAGMQKSGSGYFYNVINELIVESGKGKDARQMKQKWQLEDVMKFHNNNIGHMSLMKLLRLWKIAKTDGVFVVKTHSGPTPAARILSKLGLIRIVYSYRDPRDAMLSAMDAGKKILKEGHYHSFAKMVEFDKALHYATIWLVGWKRYAGMPEVLSVKYEEMLQDPISITLKIESFLKMPLNSEQRQKILWKFSRKNPSGERSGMHFNIAKSSRYRREMTEGQKATCKSVFGDYLLKMGYELE